MSSVEILCATMHQSDCLKKYNEMNIQSDVIFANQSDCFNIETITMNNNDIKMVTTPYRGVGNNRNIAMLFSTAEIIIFADDDLVFQDNYEEKVKKAYAEIPDADFIIFNCISKDGVKRRNTDKIKRIHYWNFLSYGTARFTARSASLKRKNITFNQLFGGGCLYCSGEDNLFLKDVITKGLKVYAYPFELVEIKESQSTWFEGYTEKYFYDHGAWLEATFSKLKYPLMLYFYFNFKKRHISGNFNTIELMKSGMMGFRNSVTYDQYLIKKEGNNYD